MVLAELIGFIEETPVLQLLFLKNDRDQSVEIEEVEDINLEDVKKHLERGESVFITQKRKRPPILPKNKRTLNANLVTKQIARGSRNHTNRRLYVTHT